MLHLSLSLLIIDLSLRFLNCPFKLLFAGDPCLVKNSRFTWPLSTWVWGLVNLPLNPCCVCVCVQFINALKTVPSFEVRVVDYKYKWVISTLLSLNYWYGLMLALTTAAIERWCVFVERCRSWSRSTSHITLMSSLGCTEPDWLTLSSFPTGPSYLNCTWLVYISAHWVNCVFNFMPLNGWIH